MKCCYLWLVRWHWTERIQFDTVLEMKIIRTWWEWGSGWGTHVNPWLIHVNIWQKPLQYCKVISLQLIKINEKKIIRTW